METLRNVWKRLTDLLALAVQGKGRAPAAKVDAKKADAAVHQFTQQFQPVFSQIEKHYQAKKTLETALKKSVGDGLKLAQDLKKQIVAADKDGYTQGTLKDDLEGRVNEIIDRLTELKDDGFGVQWS